MNHEFLSKLLNLAAQFRAMQFIYHHGHNTISGATFFSDHSVLEDFYGEMESDYDSTIERLIGLFGREKLEAKFLISLSASKMPVMNEFEFKRALDLEEALRNSLDEVVLESPTKGCEQLFGDMADRCEVRIYKLKQRVA